MKSRLLHEHLFPVFLIEVFLWFKSFGQRVFDWFWSNWSHCGDKLFDHISGNKARHIESVIQWSMTFHVHMDRLHVLRIKWRMKLHTSNAWFVKLTMFSHRCSSRWRSEWCVHMHCLTVPRDNKPLHRKWLPMPYIKYKSDLMDSPLIWLLRMADEASVDIVDDPYRRSKQTARVIPSTINSRTPKHYPINPTKQESLAPNTLSRGFEATSSH